MTTSSKADEGRLLVEIFKVEYQGEPEVKSKMQYGTVIAKTRKYQHYLYNVNDIDEGRSVIKKGNELRLTGPKSAIACPSGYLRIEVDLFFGTYEKNFRFDWLPPSDCACFYGEKTIEVKDNGKISIHFGMFYKAVEAKIEVRLLPKNKFSVDVISVVAYHIREDDQTKFSSLLFSKPGGSEVKEQSEEPIVLDRSIVAVPLGYPLHLDIVLSTKKVHEFKFDVKGEREKNLPVGDNKDYNIIAKVIWNPIHETDKDLNEFCCYSDEYYEYLDKDEEYSYSE